MSPPIDIDGSEIQEATIDGQDVSEITIDGQQAADLNVIPDSGVARWRYEQSLADEWNNNDLTGHATGYSSTTVYEGSYSREFDGGDDYDDFDGVISSPDQSFSVIAAVYPRSLSGDNRQILKWGDDPPHFDLGYIDSSGSWKWGFFDGSTFHGQTTGATTTPTDQWSHLVGTFDASTGNFTFYRDGSQVWQTTSDVNVSHNGGVGEIGAISDGTGDQWDGFLDAIDLYNKELSSTEVSNHYNTGSISG